MARAHVGCRSVGSSEAMLVPQGAKTSGNQKTGSGINLHPQASTYTLRHQLTPSGINLHPEAFTLSKE
jgi:hypothetical protein